MKKFISLLLALTMVFSLAMPAFAADDTRTIYVDVVNMIGSGQTVDSVMLDTWDSNNALIVDLGLMTHVSGTVYSYNVPSYSATAGGNIIVVFTDASACEYLFTVDPTSGNDLYTPTGNGTGTWGKYVKTQGDVTASYTPSVTIDSVTVGGDSVTVDNEKQTYTVTIPVDAESVSYYVYITGVNLDTIPDTSNDYQVSMDFGNMRFHGGRYNSELGKIELSSSVTADNVGTYDLRFTTDGGTNWFDTEWDIVVQKAEPEPTEVSLSAMLKAIDSSTGTEITDYVIAILSDSAVDNIDIVKYGLISTGDHTMTWNTVPSGYQTPANISLTVTDTNSDGVGELTSNSSHATVELVDGVYVITVTLETETTQPTIPSPIYFDNSVTNWGVVDVYFVDANNAYIKASDGSDYHVMSPVSGETNIYSAETPDGAVQVYFAAGNDCTVQTVIPTDGTNMFVPDGGTDEYGFYTGTWGTYTPGGTTEPDTAAKITGVTVKLNGVEVTEPGEIKVATSDTLTIIFEGENFENMTEEYLYQVGTGDAETLCYYEMDTTSTPNTITLTYAGYQLNGSNQSPIAYTNAGEAATETGYTLTYQMVYHVSINGHSGGTVTADKTDAVAGTLITLTVAPDEGYALYSLDVYDETIGSEIEYTKVNDTTYTFTMPAADAAVVPSFRKFGTELETIYFKNTEGWETIRAVFTSSDGVALGSADLTMVEAGIYATTDIPEWASKVCFTDSQADWTETVEIPTDGSDLFTPDGGTSEDGYLTGTWSKYTTSTPETNTVNIVWGSMAFTYTDGSGWANDGSNGAGTVTVTNTGTTAITATPSYAATTDEYGTFTGSFDEDSIGIDAGANWTFKLTLDGTPTKAIPAGTKIGTVTVTITEAV